MEVYTEIKNRKDDSVLSYKLCLKLKKFLPKIESYRWYEKGKLNKKDDFYFAHSFRGDKFISAPTRSEVIEFIASSHGLLGFVIPATKLNNEMVGYGFSIYQKKPSKTVLIAEFNSSSLKTKEDAEVMLIERLLEYCNIGIVHQSKAGAIVESKLIAGDRVTWSSQSQSYTTIKSGVVHKVIPVGTSVKDMLLPLSAEGHSIKHIKACGGPRNHESYLILVDGKILYWPVVSKLIRLDEF
jgi:hypothetical protein